jgi:predicted TIM-barrel fold metal-dependent hydrolase
MKARRFAILITLLAINLLAVVPARAGEGWIDVHFHVVGDKGEFAGFEKVSKRVVKIMNKSGMDKIIAMSPPRPFYSFDLEELLALQKQYPQRITVMGGGGTLNPMIQGAGDAGDVSPQLKQAFEARAEKILASGARGFGEITAHHVSLNPHHGYESVPADHPLLLLLADIAARHDVPIDFHFDPIPEDVATPTELDSPKNPPLLKENIRGFERLLEHNPKAKIIWAHTGSDPVGFYTPELVRRLLRKHPNLYCSIRTTFKRNNPLRHPRFGINDEWIDIIKEFPDRLVMGTDSFVVTPGYSGPNGPRVFARKTRVQREGAKEVLEYIGEDLASKIGRDNAIRLYHLDD